MSSSSGVPAGWQLSNLGTICNQVLQTGPFGSQLHAHEYVEVGVPVIMPRDLSAGKIWDTDAAKITEEKAKELSRHQIRTGDIIFSRRGDVSRAAVASTYDEGFICGTGCLRARPDSDQADSGFINLLIQTEDTKSWLEASAVGQTMPNMNTAILSKLPLLLPPLEEQRKIADILSTWDEAIEQQTRLLELKRERKRGLMQQLLTGKVRFKEFEGLEWVAIALQEVADVFMGSSPSSTAYNDKVAGLPLLQGNADIKERRSKPKIWTTEITRECHIGDILVSVRAPVGTVSLSSHHACIGRGIAAVRAKQSATIQEYLYQYLISLEPTWARLSQGSTFEAVNSKDLKELSLTIPESLEEQQKIAAVLSTADAELGTLQTQLSALRLQKRGLMQRLLTGKTRVSLA